MGVDVPVDLPDFRRDLIEEAGLFHVIAELGLKDFGEGSDGEIEIDPGGMPEAVGGGEGTTGDDVMDMGVILQGTSPGVKDPEESWKITADVFFIRSQFLDGLGGGLEQGGVSHPLIFSNEAAQLFRDGKGEHEMMTGELTLHLFFQPLLGLMVLTSRAMAIAAGAIDQMGLATFFTLVEDEAAGFGATVDDGLDDFAVYFRHSLGVALQVLRGRRFGRSH